MGNDGPAQRQSIPITALADLYAARTAAKMIARTIGFDTTSSEEIALVVAELASNLLKYAVGGMIVLIPILEAKRTGIQIESHDHGPGIKNMTEALADGSSTAGTLGYGLGTVNRIMDEFEMTSECAPPDQGTHIRCRRLLRLPVPTLLPNPLAVGIATRPHPLMEVNGDSFVLKQWGTSTLVGVIDGLGHGQYALRAAQAARQYVERHFDQPLASIFLGTGRACYATRGAVMALARFDWMPGQTHIKFAFGSIGNIDVHIIGKSEPMNFVIRRGILGVNAPPVVITEHRWQEHYVMVLHSDGISSRWNWTSFPELAKTSAAVTAQRLLQHLARDNDDATVVVVRSAIP